MGEQLAATELVAQYQQYRHRIFIRRMKRFLGRSSRHFQLLERAATISKMEMVRQEGKRTVKRRIDTYNLDMILSLGYRVNSKNATQFRI